MSNKSHFISFGLKVFLLSFASIVVSNTILYYITDYHIGKSVYESLVFLKAAKIATINYTLTVNILINAVVIFLIFLEALYMSNRISGPLYRFEKTADGLAEGDLTVNPRLRDKDLFQPQATEFSLAIDDMRERVRAVSEDAGRLEDELSLIDRKVRSGNIAGARESLVAAKERTISINRELSHFRTR